MNTVSSRSSLPYKAPPPAVTAISTAGVINSAFQLNWTSSSNVDIYKNGTLYQSNVSGQSAFIMNLSPSTSYTFGLSKTGVGTILKTANITTTANLSFSGTYTKKFDVGASNNQPWGILCNYDGSIITCMNYITPLSLYLSTNYGSTFNLVSGVSLPSVYTNNTNFYPFGTMNYLGNFIYFLGGTGQQIDISGATTCYYSTNSGSTWNTRTISGGPLKYSPNSTGYYSYNCSIKCDFTGQRIYVLTGVSGGYLYYSQDYGLSYTLVSSGMFSINCRAMIGALPDFSYVVAYGSGSSSVNNYPVYSVYRQGIDVSYVWKTIDVSGTNVTSSQPLINPSTNYTYVSNIQNGKIFVIDNNGNYINTISPTLSLGATINFMGDPDPFCACLDFRHIIGSYYDNSSNYGIWDSSNNFVSFSSLRRYPGNYGYYYFTSSYDGRIVIANFRQQNDPLSTTGLFYNSLVILS